MERPGVSFFEVSCPPKIIFRVSGLPLLGSGVASLGVQEHLPWAQEPLGAECHNRLQMAWCVLFPCDIFGESTIAGLRPGRLKIPATKVTKLDDSADCNGLSKVLALEVLSSSVILSSSMSAMTGGSR